MTRRQYSNVAPAVMTTGSLTPSATAVNVTSLTGFPASFPYTAAIERGTASEELVFVTAAVGSSVTMTRGYGGTTGKSHASSVSFEHVVDATDADEANAHVNATTNVHGAAGAVVGTTDTQTLTNKTLSASHTQATSTDPALLSLAAASGTQPHVIGKDSTGVTTEFTIAKGGAATFKATDVQALTATSVASAGAVTGASATVSGVGTFGSVTTAGTVTAGNVTTGGNVTATGTLTATGNFKAGNAGGRIDYNATTANIVSTNITEVMGHSNPYTLVSGRRYRVWCSALVNAGADGVNCLATTRFSNGTVTNASTLIGRGQSGALTAGTVGRSTVTFFGEFVSPFNGTVNIAVGSAALTGASNVTVISSTVSVDDVGV